MKGRVRLCPYYFVCGESDAARPQLGGVLATIVPADKKIVHGMADAVPRRVANDPDCFARFPKELNRHNIGRA